MPKVPTLDAGTKMKYFDAYDVKFDNRAVVGKGLRELGAVAQDASRALAANERAAKQIAINGAVEEYRAKQLQLTEKINRLGGSGLNDSAAFQTLSKDMLEEHMANYEAMDNDSKNAVKVGIRSLQNDGLSVVSLKSVEKTANFTKEGISKLAIDFNAKAEQEPEKLPEIYLEQYAKVTEMFDTLGVPEEVQVANARQLKENLTFSATKGNVRNGKFVEARGVLDGMFGAEMDQEKRDNLYKYVSASEEKYLQDQAELEAAKKKAEKEREEEIQNTMYIKTKIRIETAATPEERDIELKRADVLAETGGINAQQYKDLITRPSEREQYTSDREGVKLASMIASPTGPTIDSLNRMQAMIPGMAMTPSDKTKWLLKIVNMKKSLAGGSEKGSLSVARTKIMAIYAPNDPLSGFSKAQDMVVASEALIQASEGMNKGLYKTWEEAARGVIQTRGLNGVPFVISIPDNEQSSMAGLKLHATKIANKILNTKDTSEKNELLRDLEILKQRMSIINIMEEDKKQAIQSVLNPSKIQPTNMSPRR